MNKHSRFSRRPFIPLIVLAALTIFGFIVMGLWNALMPDIFRLPAITFWQAVGLFILARILLGGFGGPRGRRSRGGHDRRREWMGRMRERWEHMTPEQREKFRRMWQNRWDMDIKFDTDDEAPEAPGV
jgi:hypothetical protein